MHLAEYSKKSITLGMLFASFSPLGQQFKLTLTFTKLPKKWLNTNPYGNFIFLSDFSIFYI